MPKKTEIVKIDDKEYILKELTIEQIIGIFDGSTFFSNTLKGTADSDENNSEPENITNGEKQDGSILSEIESISKDLNRIMEISCNFKINDLKKLTPSEIRKIYNAFREVNSDFFVFLEKMGVAEALTNLKDAAVIHFSKMLAI